MVSRRLGHVGQLADQRQPLAEGGGMPDGVVTLIQDVGERGLIAQAARHGERVVGEREPPVPLSAEQELGGEVGEELGAQRSVLGG